MKRNFIQLCYPMNNISASTAASGRLSFLSQRRFAHAFGNVAEFKQEKSSYLFREELPASQSHCDEANTIVRRQELRAQNNCDQCGKPLKALPTVNSSNRYIHCPDCHMIYETSSGDSSPKYNVTKPSEFIVRRPPYPSEV